MVFVPLALAFIGWLIGFVFLFRIPRIRANSEPGQAATKLSIIIPARNEERNIEKLLRSLQEQTSGPHEVMVVDDGSRDRTAEIANSFGAQVVTGQPLPEGWTGKNWALTQGVEVAQGDSFLFLDADTWLEPNALQALQAQASSHPGVHSICPYHVVQKLYEQLSAFFNVLMLAGSNAFTIKGKRVREKGMFGQALWVTRKDYEAVEGHAAVKDKILENFFLAKRFQSEQIPIFAYGGKGAISMRMFPDGPKDMATSWSKAFAQGAGATPKATFIATVVWLTGAVCATVALLYTACLNVWAVVLYALFVAQIFWMLRRIGTYRFLTALFFPIPLLFFFVIFFNSILINAGVRSVKWKDRHVVGTS